MAYQPVNKQNAGFASYFVPMMLDAGRNVAYRQAIEAAVADFKRNEGRAPVVLDLGTGTGLLTHFAVEAGAAKVIAVDTNPVAISLARQALNGIRNVTFVTGKAEDYCASQGLTVDMLVTETFGTLHTTESWDHYVKLMKPYLNVFEGGRVYCVPQAAWTQARPCYVVGGAGTIGDYQTTLLSVMGSMGAWVPSNQMGMLLYNTGEPGDPVIHTGDEPVRIRSDSFETADAFGARVDNKVETRSRWPRKPNDTAVPIVVLEFESRLYGPHFLFNTVNHYGAVQRKYGAAAAVGKHTAWGFLWAYADDDSGDTCNIKLHKYGSTRDEAAGVPGMHIGGAYVEPQIASPDALAEQLRDTFTQLSATTSERPLLFSNATAAILADAANPGIHGIQVRGMQWRWLNEFLTARTKLRVFTGGKRTIDDHYEQAPVPSAQYTSTLMPVDLDALSIASVSREALVSGLVSMVPVPKKTLSRVSAPDVGDHTDAMRLEAWALPGRTDDNVGYKFVVVEQQLTYMDGSVENIITAPRGTIQRRHALTATSSVARMFALPHDGALVVPAVRITDKGKIALLE